MPLRRASKKKVRRTKTRTATKKKRSAMRRRVKYRKHRNWWKKYKGKKYRRTYKNGKLLKFTTKVPLNGLWDWMYPNCAKIIAGAAVGIKGKSNNNMFANDFGTACRNYMRSIFALDDRSVFSNNDPASHATKDQVYFYAFNPILTRNQCGAYFNHYFNQYHWVKYVGVKVKWKPNSHARYQGAYGRQVDTGQPTAGDVQAKYIPDIPAGLQQESKVIYDALGNYYFNVIFDKDSFMPIPYNVRAFNVAYTDIPNNNTPDAYLQNTILRRLKMFDQYDQSVVKCKKYNLSRPFKFYVRPYEQVYHNEVSKFEAKEVRRDNETASAYLNGLTESINNDPIRDAHLGIPHPATWRRTNVFCPHWLEAAPTVTGDTGGDFLKSTQYLNCLMRDSLYYNPVLFGFNFTADTKDRDKLYSMVAIEHVKAEHACNLPDLDSAVSISATPNTSMLGNFYFTVYLRFKGRRQNQVIPAISSLPDPIYGTDNTPSWYS